MPIACHFCYSVKQRSCLDNKHLAASSSEGSAAGVEVVVLVVLVVVGGLCVFECACDCV